MHTTTSGDVRLLGCWGWGPPLSSCRLSSGSHVVPRPQLPFMVSSASLHNTLCDVLCHWAHLGVQVEAGNDLMADHSHTHHPADLLLTSWATGETAAFDTSVTSLLNTHTLMEVEVSAGSAALATEGRKHRANDAKCGELGWLCVPLVAETYGAWGNEAIEAFSQLASRLATLTCRPKSAALSDIYGRLNLHLVRVNAIAILTTI